MLLVEIITISELDLIQITNDDGSVEIAAETIKNLLEVGPPMLESIGYFHNAALVTIDDSENNTLEIAFPHSLDNTKILKLKVLAEIESTANPFVPGLRLPSQINISENSIKVQRDFQEDILQQPEISNILQSFSAIDISRLFQ